jgi:hypothetical protein
MALIAACLLTLLPAWSWAATDPGEFDLRPVLLMEVAQTARLRALIAADAEASALAVQVSADAVAALAVAPAPLAVIHYEGLVNTDPRRIATVERLRGMDAVAALMRHYQCTGDPATAARLLEHVAAWAAAYRPTGNDVNENKLLPLFIGWATLQEQASPEQRSVIGPWIADLATRHRRAVQESRHFTNRYTKQVRLAMILGGPDARALTIEGVKRFISGSLRTDGSSLDLELRDTLTYHNSALVPVLEILLQLGPEGRALYDWTSPAGGSLRRSVDFVVSYARGEKTREEWVNSRADLDRRRAEAGIEHYRKGRLYEPKQAAGLMEAAGAIDPTLVPLHAQLVGSTATRFPSWTVLVGAAMVDPVTR